MSRFLGTPITNRARMKPATVATAIMVRAMSGPEPAFAAPVEGKGAVLRYQSKIQIAKGDQSDQRARILQSLAHRQRSDHWNLNHLLHPRPSPP